MTPAVMPPKTSQRKSSFHLYFGSHSRIGMKERIRCQHFLNSNFQKKRNLARCHRCGVVMGELSQLISHRLLAAMILEFLVEFFLKMRNFMHELSLGSLPGEVFRFHRREPAHPPSPGQAPPNLRASLKSRLTEATRKIS